MFLVKKIDKKETVEESYKKTIVFTEQGISMVVTRLKTHVETLFEYKTKYLNR